MGESGADCSLMLSKGLAFINQATAADAEGRAREAIRLYSLGLESLLSVLKFERNERITSTLRLRVREYMARAEQLKAQISTMEAPSPSLALPTPPASLPVEHAPSAHAKASPARAPVRVAAPAASTPPIAKNATPPPAVAPAAPPPAEIRGPTRIELQEGQLNCSYASVLGPHLAGSSDVTLCYPQLHSEHHVRNLLAFVELLVRQGTCRLLSLETSPPPNAEDGTAVSAMLAELAHSSAERGVHIQVQPCDADAAPYILTSTGKLITLPRALDWFAMSTGRLVVGASDFDLRPCRHTVIEMYALPAPAVR